MQICVFDDCVGKCLKPFKCSTEASHVSYINGLKDTSNWDLFVELQNLICDHSCVDGASAFSHVSNTGALSQR